MQIFFFKHHAEYDDTGRLVSDLGKNKWSAP